MEGLLHNISLGMMFVIITYGLGVAVRYSADVRLGFGYSVGLILFGLALNVAFFGGDVHVVPPVSTFLWVAVFAGPLGFITAPMIMSRLSARTESFLASDGFDKTYRKYAKSHKKRDDNFRWYDAKDYSQWRQQTYRRTGGGFGQQGAGRSHGQGHYGGASNGGVSETDKWFRVLGLDGQNVTASDVKSAYRKLARQYHPDALASQNLSEAKVEAAMKKMQEINAAYDGLKDNGYA